MGNTSYAGSTCRLDVRCSVACACTLPQLVRRLSEQPPAPGQQPGSSGGAPPPPTPEQPAPWGGAPPPPTPGQPASSGGAPPPPTPEQPASSELPTCGSPHVLRPDGPPQVLRPELRVPPRSARASSAGPLPPPVHLAAQCAAAAPVVQPAAAVPTYPPARAWRAASQGRLPPPQVATASRAATLAPPQAICSNCYIHMQ